MRYSIAYTPSASDFLGHAGASWLGRNIFSGEAVEHPALPGVGMDEIAFHTALPRREGFRACLKAPFRLRDDASEAGLLRALMRFAGTVEPFSLPDMEVARLGDCLGLVPAAPCEVISRLASLILHGFDEFRAPLSEEEIERMAPERLSAPQFANLYRWGDPHVQDEFRFYLPLTGPLEARSSERLRQSAQNYFRPLLERGPMVLNLALLVEQEPGAPFVVHSLHPMGRVSARRIA
ncbi:DUF1045 domain-containing protein [Allorhizobium undicola]|uniref:DUF1045 domain-containing protein n=1 Tax=Allorhizobium undicola TaxID=78527 RepID=UPI0004849B22|nr:DUF1045 domain-containing protein [Allorhizobium undicola]